MNIKPEFAVAKLQAALGQAPKPVAKPTTEWMVTYMIWYYETCKQALADT